MTIILKLYGTHGLLITASSLICLAAMCISLVRRKSLNDPIFSFARKFWIAAGLSLIALMTLSTSNPNEIVSFPALHVSEIVKDITKPSTSATATASTATDLGATAHWSLHLPDWHDPVANILMTVPLATALALTWAKRRVVLTIALLSISIEVTQYFYGHGRTAQVSDVVLNTIGGLVGVGLATLSYRIAKRIWPDLTAD